MLGASPLQVIKELRAVKGEDVNLDAVRHGRSELPPLTHRSAKEVATRVASYRKQLHFPRRHFSITHKAALQ